jgi:hypothetical protein
MAIDWPLPGIDLADAVLAGAFGSALQTDVPTLYPVAINGMPFKVEVNQVRRRTLDALRTAAFQGSTPSEASLSTEAAWLRSQRTWRYGAGLITADNQDDGLDNPLLSQRYLDSWNMEPDRSGEGISMMRRASTLTAGVTGTPIRCGQAVSVGPDTFAIIGNDVQRITTSGHTVCTGMGAEVPKAVASDGYTVWIVTQVDATHVRMWTTSSGSTVFSAMGASVVVTSANVNYNLFYGNGLLLLTLNLTLYSVSSAGALGTAIDTISTVSANTSAFVHKITCSATFFYFAISTPSISNLPYAIYKISVDNTGAFTKFTAAAPSLGPSENVGPILVEKNSIMLIGTNRGFRVGDIDANGNLSVGPLVRITDSESIGMTAPSFGVTSFTRFQDKILASWSVITESERYSDGVSSIFYNNVSQLQCGLIEIDLGRFTADLVPAWWFWWRETTVDGAFTMRATVAENASNPIVFQFDRYYMLGTTNLISPCSLITSWYTFGMDPNKTFVDIEFFHDALATGDTIQVYYQVDDDPDWNLTGTSNISGTYSISSPVPLSVNTRRMRFGFILTAGDITQLTTPRLRRFQLRAFPTPTRTEEIILPLIVHDAIRVGEDEKQDVVVDTRGAYDALNLLVKRGQPVYYQEGDRTYLVKVDKLELQPDHWSMDPGTGQYRFYQGYIVTRLLTL